MPWKEVTRVDQRKRLIELALLPGANVSGLCYRMGISRKTAYKWLSRYEPGKRMSLEDQSRRPKNSPQRVDKKTEALILHYRDQYPTWGGRKLRKLLINSKHDIIPSASTITEVLRRYHQLSVTKSTSSYQRFERGNANELWQMDFKGHFAIASGRCHPLTILDDHSRFSICLKACENETKEVVKLHLMSSFRDYGLPVGINVDNGPPWGNSGDDDPNHLCLWLMRCGIRVTHSRPYHPQTNGKDERFHRTLKQELINQRTFNSQADTQVAFDDWRHTYNYVRPHEAKDMRTPSQCYRSSERSYVEKLPPIDYADGEIRKVDAAGRISFKNKVVKVGKAFIGESIAVKETDQEGVYALFFIHSLIKKIDLKVLGHT